MVEEIRTRIPSQMEGPEGKCIHRKRDMDNYCRAGHDFTDRGSSQCIGQSVQPDYQQPQLYTLEKRRCRTRGIRGNSFIEILVVLPVFLTVIFGSLGVFMWAQESYAAGQAAQVGVSEWASTDNRVSAQRAMNDTLRADGYSPQTAHTQYTQQGSLDAITVSLPFQAAFWTNHEVISASRSAVQKARTAGRGTQRWW